MAEGGAGGGPGKGEAAALAETRAHAGIAVEIDARSCTAAQDERGFHRVVKGDLTKASSSCRSDRDMLKGKGFYQDLGRFGSAWVCAVSLDNGR